VLGAGSGTRFGADRNKVYYDLGGRPILVWSLEAMLRAPRLRRLLLVVRAEERDAADELVREHLPDVEIDIVVGGATRHQSELRALRRLAPAVDAGEIDLVVIHDGARPLASAALTERVLAEAAEHGGAIPGVPVERTLRVDEGVRAASALQPARARRVQTPQAFRAAALLAAYEASAADGYEGTDTSACVARYTDLRTRCVDGEETNVKITVAEDLPRAEALLASFGRR
jgi:2-C-methyl-D-erythritol 4-phosphate cytidylyltransferase